MADQQCARGLAALALLALAHCTGEVSEPTGPSACGAAPDGATETRRRFASATVPFGGSCQEEEQTRTCEAGTWTAWSGSFASEVCAVGA
jgi:hypothetical protein